MYFDGSLTLNGAESGMVVLSPRGDRLQYALQLHFKATNNVTVYEALLNGLRIAINLGVRPRRLRAGGKPGHEGVQLL